MDVRNIGGDSIYQYVQNQNHKAKNFQVENSMSLETQADRYSEFNKNNTSPNCTVSYPLGSLRNDSSYVDTSYIDYRQKNPNYLVQQSGFVDTGSKLSNKNIPMENFQNDLVPTNDPTNDSLLDMKARPLTDFYHNNMVPFYGSYVKQNMAGTGVASGNYTDGVNVNSGFDDESPFLGKLNRFTGLDDTYLHKRETGPQFSPAEQQTGWVNGMPLARPDENRYKVSLNVRNDLAPCEKQLVGPGIDIGPEIPAQGGFHQYTRLLPNNVSDYKANQLQGRVITQGWQLGGQEPTAQYINGVTKNKANSFWSQTRYPTMTTRASQNYTAEELRPNYDISKKPGNANREQTNYGFGTIVYKDTIPPNEKQLYQSYNLVTGEQKFANI